jgi:hypothetical protein
LNVIPLLVYIYVKNSMLAILQLCRQMQLNPPDYAVLTLVIVKSDQITVLLMKASLFHGTYLRCNCWFIDISMCVILPICCQIQGTKSVLPSVKSCPSKIQHNYFSCHSDINIQLTVSPSILSICRQFIARYNPQFLPNAA